MADRAAWLLLAAVDESWIGNAVKFRCQGCQGCHGVMVSEWRIDFIPQKPKDPTQQRCPTKPHQSTATHIIPYNPIYSHIFPYNPAFYHARSGSPPVQVPVQHPSPRPLGINSPSTTLSIVVRCVLFRFRVDPTNQQQLNSCCSRCHVPGAERVWVGAAVQLACGEERGVAEGIDKSYLSYFAGCKITQLVKSARK